MKKLFFMLLLILVVCGFSFTAEPPPDAATMWKEMTYFEKQYFVHGFANGIMGAVYLDDTRSDFLVEVSNSLQRTIDLDVIEYLDWFYSQEENSSISFWKALSNRLAILGEPLSD